MTTRIAAALIAAGTLTVLTACGTSIAYILTSEDGSPLSGTLRNASR